MILGDKQGVCLTVGFFDGVHLGHRFVLQRLREEAAQRGMQAIVLTFDCHPRTVVNADYRPLMLSALADKLRMLRLEPELQVEVLHFDVLLAAMTAEEFMREVLLKRYNVRCLVMGYDHRFGRPQGADVDYTALGASMGMEVLRLPVYEEDGVHFSSTAVRRALAEGDIRLANRIMGRQFSMRGTVHRGRSIGRTIAFPTANVGYALDHLVPRRGVYAGAVEVDGTIYHAMINVGVNPTVSEDGNITIEAFLLNFEGDLYGQELVVYFEDYLREERRFSGLDELRKQIEMDVTKAKELWLM